MPVEVVHLSRLVNVCTLATQVCSGSTKPCYDCDNHIWKFWNVIYWLVSSPQNTLDQKLYLLDYFHGNILSVAAIEVVDTRAAVNRAHIEFFFWQLLTVVT